MSHSPYGCKELDMIRLNIQHWYVFVRMHQASLVVQWLRIHLAIHGTPFRSLVEEDPTCLGATEPLLHNY